MSSSLISFIISSGIFKFNNKISLTYFSRIKLHNNSVILSSLSFVVLYKILVKFTERGFAIEGTRLSFETVEHALSKNYMITLNNGQGIVLDSVKMQKILKYKGRWFPANPGSNEQSGQ